MSYIQYTGMCIIVYYSLHNTAQNRSHNVYSPTSITDQTLSLERRKG